MLSSLSALRFSKTSFSCSCRKLLTVGLTGFLSPGLPLWTSLRLARSRQQLQQSRPTELVLPLFRAPLPAASGDLSPSLLRETSAQPPARTVREE
ncbi:hypothetical protein LEMLEM_LOCUS17629 [Lemmus lemmus]